VPEEVEISLFGRYVGAAHRRSGLRCQWVCAAHATLAAQRATKILGIFARLRPPRQQAAVPAHLPRIFAYVRRALTHPSLAALDNWYHRVPPP